MESDSFLQRHPYFKFNQNEIDRIKSGLSRFDESKVNQFIWHLQARCRTMQYMKSKTRTPHKKVKTKINGMIKALERTALYLEGDKNWFRIPRSHPTFEDIDRISEITEFGLAKEQAREPIRKSIEMLKIARDRETPGRGGERINESGFFTQVATLYYQIFGKKPTTGEGPFTEIVATVKEAICMPHGKECLAPNRAVNQAVKALKKSLATQDL